MIKKHHSSCKEASVMTRAAVGRAIESSREHDGWVGHEQGMHGMPARPRLEATKRMKAMAGVLTRQDARSMAAVPISLLIISIDCGSIGRPNRVIGGTVDGARGVCASRSAKKEM